MKTVFILMDSLNRHFLSAYGSEIAKTPNIDRLCGKSVRFTNHFAGSLPCMPARREMMTGRTNFLEAPWGPIEPFDDCLPVELRKQAKVYSHMITDHYHYFHSGGEAYHTLFDSWEFVRGQESDVWRPLVKPPETPNFKGKNTRPYWANRQFMDSESDEDYSTPQCFMRAMDFLENNHDQDNWHLHLEVFDPHEPFACPKKYRDMYDDQWDDEKCHYDWPQYAPADEDNEAVQHIRKSYAATLTMADHWLGKLLDKMDQHDMWKDTAIVLTTDHGHLLGEHGYYAKNYMMDYTELAHIPLFMHIPGMHIPGGQSDAGKTVNSLSATIDMMPTLMDLHGCKTPKSAHGKSLLHLLDNDEGHHDTVLYGYFGKDINMYDGKYTYCRQPLPDSVAYHHTAMPRSFHDFISTEKLAGSEVGDFLPHAKGVPVYRMKTESHRHDSAPDFNPIYDLENDPAQTAPIQDEKIEAILAEKLRLTMKRLDAPESEFIRVGL